MFYLIYNITSIFLLIPVVLYHLYRSVSRSRPPALAERFGFVPRTELMNIAGRPVIWLHAVSVGETIAARPLIKALRTQYPDNAIVLSATTETGRSVAEGYLEKDLCIYFPFDFLPVIRRTFDSIKPHLIIIMETEIWPNFSREAHLRGIPLLLANGRISDRSFSGYQRFAWFFRQPLGMFTQICMQTSTDSDRIISIGAPAERVVTLGNLKYDIPFQQVKPEERLQLRQNYAIPEGMLVITAGSTHKGEDELVLAAYRELSAVLENIFLILVPRHPERAPEVADLLEKNGLVFRRRTGLATATAVFAAGEVLLVDTIGEMMGLYALSDIAFVGGSLVPTGGHNLLEPASAGVPCVFGPHMNNFREISALVLEYGAGIQVESGQTLTEALCTLLENVTLRQVLGQNGLKMMRDNGGATQRHMHEIARFL